MSKKINNAVRILQLAEKRADAFGEPVEIAWVFGPMKAQPAQNGIKRLTSAASIQRESTDICTDIRLDARRR